MNLFSTTGTRSIGDAVRDGTLIDVSKMAKEVGLPYPTFMSPALAAKYESQCPGGGVLANLSFFADLLYDYDYSIYGPVFSGDHVCILEPHEEFGHVVLILRAGEAEELDLLRATGDRFEYAM